MTDKAIDFGVEMKANGKRGEVRIYDVIGESFWGDSVSAKSVREELDKLGDIDEIDLRINSQGGAVFHALAIYNALKEHPAKVNVHIDGLAASAASLIAMVGDSIFISENAFVMIHNPRGYVYGESKEMRKYAQTLEQIRKSAVATYADRTGQSKSKIGEMMDEETWLSSDEAIDKGFADEITKNKSKGEKSEKMISDLSQFHNVPEGALNLVAMLSKEKPEMTEEIENTDSESQETVERAELAEMDTSGIKAEGAAEERKRSKQIRVLCEMSGCPEKADKFIDAEFSVDETREALAALMEKQNKVIETDDTDQQDDKQAAIEAKYRKEFSEQKHIHSQLGITEDDYVEQRMIEDGHKEEPALMPGLK